MIRINVPRQEGASCNNTSTQKAKAEGLEVQGQFEPLRKFLFQKTGEGRGGKEEEGRIQRRGD